MRIFTVYDEKACVFGQPQFMLTDGIALRMFGDLIQDPSTVIAKHPEDFALYEIGSYDETTGIITPKEHPAFVIRATSLKYTGEE